jgi:hypothetical protein
MIFQYINDNFDELIDNERAGEMHTDDAVLRYLNV